MRTLLRTLALVGAGTMAAASAEAAEGSFFLDCSDAPSSAVLDVPAPLGAFAQVVCTRYGHVIHAEEGVAWALPEGPHRHAFVPAQDIRTEEELGHEAHFTDISATEVDDSERDQWIEMLEEYVDPQSEGVPAVFRLTAEHYDGRITHVPFFVTVAQDALSGVWGMTCTEDCVHREGSFNGLPFQVLPTADRSD